MTVLEFFLRRWKQSACREPVTHSELKLKCQLDRAGAADLVQRIEAAALTAASQGVCQHLRGLTELGRTQEIDGIPEVGMVKDVEEISSCLK